MYFPRLYPDELLYSGIARCRVHLGMENHKGLLNLLFNDSKVAAITDLPTHLDDLASNTGLDANYLIYHHTLFPLYAPFIPQQRRVNLYKAMLGKDKPTIGLAGISTSTVKWPEWLRYCPKCLKEMVDQLGEPYWKRSWQIEGNVACARHSCLLLNSHIPYRRIQRHEFHAASSQLLDRDQRELLADESEVLLARSFEQLIKGLCKPSPEYGRWTNFYRHIASMANARRGQQVRSEVIWERVQGAFNKDYLERHRLREKATLPPLWLTAMFRKHRKSFSPLQHLVVWTALKPNVSVDDVFADASSRQSYKLKNDRTISSSVTSANSECYRQQWCSALDRYESPSIARENQKACYAWLYRHDRKWLMRENAARRVKRGNSRQVDWVKRDRYLVKLLIRLDYLVGESMDQPRQSRNWYLAQIPHRSSVEHNLHRLPLCRNFLAGHSESIGEYQIRRITRELCIDARQGVTPNLWELKRRCGLEDSKLQPLSVRFLRCIGSYLE
ncbi:hypothetical protein LMG33818_001758 [Halomonadaceae bacterium LMG 33818]|uniref:TnsD family Tn7-like transposition protein n=1 Tax=Cernens ardua TaxID=3402176 RepID=UPI003EDC6A2C